jgi:hypothetical protein
VIWKNPVIPEIPVIQRVLMLRTIPRLLPRHTSSRLHGPIAPLIPSIHFSIGSGDVIL